VQNAQSLSTSVRIAHLSDVHMLSARRGPAESVLDLSLRFVSFGRALDPAPRRSGEARRMGTPELHVLHGHLHYEVDLPFGPGEIRILGAPAVVDDVPGTPRVRLYDVDGACLRSVAPSIDASKRAIAA
jgi:hypothetical protein